MFPRGWREQTTSQKSFKNIKIREFGDYNIWNHHEKCIQISPNMPDICLNVFVKCWEF